MDIFSCIRKVLVNIPLLVLIVELDLSATLTATVNVFLALYHELDKDAVVFFYFSPENISLKFEDVLADFVRFHEVLVELDELGHFLDLILKSALQDIGILNKLVLLEKLSNFHIGYDSRMLKYILFEIRAHFLSLLLVFQSNFVTKL